jgi:hypothetical protein
MRTKRQLTVPDIGLLEAELRREQKKNRIIRVLRKTANTLMLAAAVSVLKKGLPVPAAKTTTSPLRSCLRAMLRT